MTPQRHFIPCRSARMKRSRPLDLPQPKAISAAQAGRSRSHESAVRGAHIEPLSPRVLLSSTLAAAILTVDGTPGDDLVIVAGNKRFVNVLTVILNDELFHYSLAALNSIRINTGDGDDKIWIDSSL